jgi:hypothetical protein
VTLLSVYRQPLIIVKVMTYPDSEFQQTVFNATNEFYPGWQEIESCLRLAFPNFSEEEICDTTRIIFLQRLQRPDANILNFQASFFE